MNTYLGLDCGGTKLLIGEMDSKGNVLRSKRYPTGYKTQGEAAEGILESLRDYQDTVGFEGELKLAGIGIVGISDSSRGLWISLNHMVTEPPVPLASMISRQLGVPCGIDNDVRCATTAELLLGKGRESKNFIYLNVGTGLAAGFVIEGKILGGANHNSGEIGHMVIDMSNPLTCICGRTGCVENMVSGTGFTRQAKEYNRADLLNEEGNADVEKLFALADSGDEICVKITEYAAESLAGLIMNLVRVTDPDTVILGGGVISDGWLLEKVRPKLEQHTMRGVTGGVVLSSFPIRLVGVIGAAAAGMVRFVDC